MVMEYNEREIGISATRKIIAAINDTYKIDYGNFALTSFRRRIAGFLEQHDSLRLIDDFVKKLETNPQFFEDFRVYLNISVTEMFRDPSFWRDLRDIFLPQLINKHNNINVWMPGISTGEELYTFLILLHELNIQNNVKLLATDIHQRILNNIGKTIMSASKVEDIYEANYKRYQGTKTVTHYLDKCGNGYVIKPDLLRNIDMKIYDLANDTTILDNFQLIICRNTFVSFNSNLQGKVLDIFIDSLEKRGLLCIGIKESLTCCRNATKFTLENEHENIYRKIID